MVLHHRIRKKKVLIDKEDSYQMLLTTNKAALHTTLSSLQRFPYGSNKCESDAFSGLTKGVYMQHALVVKLDEKV